jgi:uncharacterized coiled-coil DUF342 family protein
MQNDKFPELRQAKAKLEAEKATIVEKSAPLRAERDKLAASIAPVEARMRELAEEIHAIERPRLPTIDNQLGVLARAMGGRSMSNSPK